MTRVANAEPELAWRWNMIPATSPASAAGARARAPPSSARTGAGAPTDGSLSTLLASPLAFVVTTLSHDFFSAVSPRSWLVTAAKSSDASSARASIAPKSAVASTSSASTAQQVRDALIASQMIEPPSRKCGHLARARILVLLIL